MAFEIATGLFTLAGATVGGGATFAVNWLTARNQRKLAEQTRSQAVVDRRYMAHIDFLARADRFQESLRSLWERLLDRSPGEVIISTNVAYLEAWVAMSDARGSAQIAGPPELEVKLVAFYEALKVLSSHTDQWYVDRAAEDTDARQARAQRLWGKVEAKRSEYISLGQKTLSK
ncbi:hypothetical protein [Nocardia tenerifensis]|nr:hypothetical protein [Nocardia tenerifensis]